MIAEIEEINAQLNSTHQSLSIKIYNPFLSFLLGTKIKDRLLRPNIEGVILRGFRSAAGRKRRI